MTGQQGACPQCGAPLSFGGGHSLATVCSYCRSAVARKGVDLELIGKIPDLVSTSTRLQLGDQGRLDKSPFRIAGRLQLDQGAAAWDEWYLHFADGSDGWLAEAQGALFATRRYPADPRLPPFSALQPGGKVEVAGIGPMSAQEIGEGRFVSADGELPFAPRLGASYRFADLSGPKGSFATLDYGERGEEPEVFVGHRISYRQAGLEETIRGRTAAPATAGAEGIALACPTCGAPLDLKRKESSAATCPSCRSLLDVGNGSTLTVMGKLGKRTEPSIPLGARGTLDGLQVEVLGYLRRQAQSDGESFEWSEWQLWSDQGYRYLSESQGNFHWLAPVPAGEVRGGNEEAAVYGGVRYRHFSTCRARYRDLQGELSWHARADDTVQVLDFTAPPLLLSCEREKGEVNWSAGRYITGAEVWKGLALPGYPPQAVGVGVAQPNPHEASKRRASLSAALGLVALVLLAALLSAALPRQTVTSLAVPLVAEGVALSEPFELKGSAQSVQLVASAEMQQSWAGLEIALINEGSGEAHTLGLELSHFEGADDGERWREGSRVAKATLGSIPGGTYLLRAEVTLDPRSSASVPPAAHLEVIRGVFTYAPFFLALFALLPAPLWTRLRASGFERRRWSESDHSGGDDE